MLVIDRREVQEHPDIPGLIGIPYSIDTLDSGDYALLDRDSNLLGIERCHISNLIQKLRSGELEEQLTRCSELYASTILLTEGVYDEVGGLLATHKKSDRGYYRVSILPHTYLETIMASLSSMSEMGIELVHSPNFECSITLIRAIYKQRTKPEEQRSLFRKIRVAKIPTKLSNNPAVSRLMGLTTRMPEKVAVRLIHQYGSIWGVLNAEDSDLLQVDGMGKGLLAGLKKGTGKE